MPGPRAPRMRIILPVLAYTLSAGAFAQQGASVDADTQARQFLLRYAGLSSTSNVALLDLYRDDARIRAASFLGERQMQDGIVRGDQWKRQLRAGWHKGTSRLEASSFQESSVLRDGDRLVIRARRYSQTGCYWDNGYAVVIAPDRVGQYQIVEERISFQRAASCPGASEQTLASAAPNPAAAAVTQGPVAAPAPFLPAGPRPAALPANVFRIRQGGAP